ncbi:MAG: EscU/YscU/HrcU family type III secretion system export apparatus switch protein [Alphaproteobacteria bacterium]
MANEDKPPFDKNKVAVALRYEIGKDDAPRVAAKGKGYLAEQIIAIARAHNVEIREDADLAVMLEKLDIDTPIPMEAYVAVAEILSYIYKKNDAMKGAL